jgi:hypothetical protein
MNHQTHGNKFKQNKVFTSTISSAIKHAACFIEASRGIAAVIHEPAIDPTVLLYLLESFNLNEMLSHCSIFTKTLKYEPVAFIFQLPRF